MSPKPETDPRITTIVVSKEVGVPPERVLEAARDFSERRPKVFPAVSTRHLTVHSIGPATADVCEGTRVGPFVLWERCDYDWSQPGRVLAMVTDSNIYASPGSSWEITATASERGSHVEMTWTRGFRRRPMGRLMGFVYRHFGERSFDKYGHDILQSLEALESGALTT